MAFGGCWGRAAALTLWLVGMFVFLFTDIEGSTSLLQRLGAEVYAGVLADHHALIRSALAGHGGAELNTAGDGFFARFSSPRACVAAAVEMQQTLAAHVWPAGERVRVRMGVHAGEAEETAAGPVGLDVHRAARIAVVGHGGQVLVSETAAVLLRDALPPGAVLRDLGVHRLKDLGRPEQIFQLCGPGLAAEFPPLRSLGSPTLPNNLPAQLAAFVGRVHEMAEVAGLIKAGRLVTLTGAGGAGKTRLALQVAADLLDGWADGVWLAELAAVTDPDVVPAAVAGALRIPAQPGRPVLDTLADALGPQDALIVLDNCEHVIGGCAKTVETVLQRCPKVHLIATSREPVGIAGEIIYRVPSLSVPNADDPSNPAEVASCDAVALLADRARTQGAPLVLDAETVPLVVSVCRRLDGMPLAIELAAARLRSMSVVELAGRLDQRFRLLTGGSRTALERQQTLRAAIGWSYGLLTTTEQVMLGRLSVFADGFDLAAAEAVCGYGTVNELDVAGLVGSLVDKSLVQAEPAGPALRYRLLETIRLYAAERLADDDQEAASAAAAHSAHYLAVAEAAAPHLEGPDQASWLARLDTEHANLLRAAQHAAGDPDDTTRVLRFGIALWRYWIWLGPSGEEQAAGLLLPALQRPEARADPRLFADALAFAALCTVVTDGKSSLRLAERANELARGLADDRLVAWSCGVLCHVCGFSGDPERARLAGQESVERARKVGDDVLLAQALLVYAWAVGVAASGPLYAEAFACTERSGDLAVSHALHNDAGFAALEVGDVPAARAHLEAAIAAAQAVGQQHLLSSVNLAQVLRAEHDPDAARSEFEEVVRASRRIGDKYALAAAFLGLACMAADVNDWHRVGVMLGAEQALMDQMKITWGPFEARRRQETWNRAASVLGEQQFQQAYARGMALSPDQAIDLALRRALG